MELWSRSMMDWPRNPSLIVTVLQVLSAPDIYIVVGSHGREAAVPSGRPSGRTEARAGIAGTVVGA